MFLQFDPWVVIRIIIWCFFPALVQQKTIISVISHSQFNTYLERSHENQIMMFQFTSSACPQRKGAVQKICSVKVGIPHTVVISFVLESSLSALTYIHRMQMPMPGYIKSKRLVTAGNILSAAAACSNPVGYFFPCVVSLIIKHKHGKLYFNYSRIANISNMPWRWLTCCFWLCLPPMAVLIGSL